MSKPPRLRVIANNEADNVDYVVCLRVGSPSPFSDNMFGTCTKCGCAVFFRPYMPKKPPKICLECVSKLDELEMAKS